MRIFAQVWLGMLLSVELWAEGNGDAINVWIGLFTLAVIGIIILFRSSRQEKKLHEMHQQMMQRQLDMERKQNDILTNMSENVHEIAQKALEESHVAIQNSNKTSKEKSVLLDKVEDRLLGVTNDLIDFLRLKSKKLEVKKDDFNFNNVLNEVSGNLGSKFVGKDIELIFDIDSKVPRYLHGDSLYLGQILNSILETMMEPLLDEEIKVEITAFSPTDDKVELQLHFSDTGNGLTQEEKEGLFIPYFDETTGSYVGLGLFVARELVTLMGGVLSVDSVSGKGTSFTLVMPFDSVDAENKRKYRLPSKVLTEKKVFIVDTNHHSALALKKMFAYFRHEVTVVSREEFGQGLPNLHLYDIVVISEALFSTRLVEYLHNIKKNKELKVIAINSLLKVGQNRFVDECINRHLFKPANQERIFELVISLYDVSVPEGFVEENRLKAKVHRESINEKKGVTRVNFSEYSGKKLLIVEDSPVNQKVLLNVLANAGMEIAIANNGREAVDMVKSGKTDYDIILMDINMPVMDGYTATQMIRLDHKYDHVPIVAFTALVLDSEIRKMFSSGINAFLPKPLNIGKLYNAFSIYISDKAIERVAQEAKKRVEVFDGLEIEEGIRHSNGNEALYIELLKEFKEVYGESYDSFAQLVREKRYEQVKMLCIDMRGLSGTIGAKGMLQLINEVYHVILYKKFDQVSNYTERYKAEIERLNKAIDDYVTFQDDLVD